MTETTTRPRTGTPRRSPKRFSAVAYGAAGIVLFFLLLDLCGLLFGIPENQLPRSLSVGTASLTVVTDPEFLASVWATVSAALTGLVLATLLAVPIGVLFGTNRRTFAAVSTLIEFMRPLPVVALIPPALLILGAGSEMKIALVMYSTFWIILFNTIYAVRGVEPLQKDAARVFGVKPLGTLVRVVLPSAAPFIYTGIQIAATAALLVTIGTEMLAGGSGGIGEWLMTYLNAITRREFVYAGAYISGVIGLLLTLALIFGGRLLFPWNKAAGGRTS
ncbi:ABC transporter permease [Citricoccus sp. GCM10030269]|uniref:ABC transporter permease n=1 Tax=Citricoccus sp. GCM10030269 TaxID=3273388 RepID=UPI00360E2EF0